MNKNQKICLWIGIAVIVLMGLLPPWKATTEGSVGGFGVFGYKFIMNPPDEMCRIDTSRLYVQWLMVAAITGGLSVTLADKERKEQRKRDMNWQRGFRRIVFVLSLVGACLGFYFVRELASELLCSETGYNLGVLRSHNFGYTDCELTSRGEAICVLAAIFIGPLVGFGIVWLVYYSIRWLVLGFVADKPKEEPKQ